MGSVTTSQSNSSLVEPSSTATENTSTACWVADQSGKQFTVLATPDSEALLGLKTGATHRISRDCWGRPTTADDIGAECPDCGDAGHRG